MREMVTKIIATLLRLRHCYVADSAIIDAITLLR